jgi:hypothetical protein
MQLKKEPATITAIAALGGHSSIGTGFGRRGGDQANAGSAAAGSMAHSEWPHVQVSSPAAALFRQSSEQNTCSGLTWQTQGRCAHACR